jgi:hypothetical protein
MSEGEQQQGPRVHDPNSPATEPQRRWLVAHGVDPNAANDPRVTKGQASEWISGIKAEAEKRAQGAPDRPGQQTLPTGQSVAVTGQPAAPVTTTTAAPLPGFVPASQLPPSGPPPAAPPPEASAVAVYRDEEDQGPLTPVAAMSEKERDEFGISETATVVLRGTKWSIVPELGMPAKFVFARISQNRRTGRTEVRLFPSIEGLTFRANAYNKGIRKYTYEFVKQEDIPGLAAFIEETRDPELVCRVHVTLGDGTEVTEQGTVRVSEVRLYQSRRTGKMVARSPVARSNPMELAIKRALARALRWGTGFGGTALDELPVSESEEARERAGLKGGPAALPAGAPAPRDEP